MSNVRKCLDKPICSASLCEPQSPVRGRSHVARRLKVSNSRFLPLRQPGWVHCSSPFFFAPRFPCSCQGEFQLSTVSALGPVKCVLLAARVADASSQRSNELTSGQLPWSTTCLNTFGSPLLHDDGLSWINCLVYWLAYYV